MPNSSLNQFGSVLTFAIELEKSLGSFYDNTTSKDNLAKYLDEMRKRSSSAIKRVKKIERSRRENVTEITLEPIEGLSKENYLLNLEDFRIEVINSNESIMVRYYAEAGPKLNVLESRRLFKQLHKEHNNLMKLE